VLGRSTGGPFQNRGDQILTSLRQFNAAQGAFAGQDLSRTLGGGAQAGGAINPSGTPGALSFEDFVRSQGIGGFGQSAASALRSLIGLDRAKFAQPAASEFIDPQDAGQAFDATQLALSALGTQVSPLLLRRTQAFQRPERLFHEFQTGTGGGSGNFLDFLRSRLGLRGVGF
jgi:hypothetical protein